MTSQSDNPVWPGRSYPLGATWDGKGVNFALFSENAEKVELCLFDAKGHRETERLALPEYTDQIWHGYFPSVRPGDLYGYRVYGPYAPAEGHRFNHHKLLVDPYAKALQGKLVWNEANFGYRFNSPKEDLSFDRRNNARFVPKAVVVDAAFSWDGDRPPQTRWEQSFIYELHVKGMTELNPEIPDSLRGSFAGLGSPAIVEHLHALGVTAVELLPVHPIADELHLVKKGLRNYWGYNSYCFFAPEPRYLSTGAIDEFKTMVRQFHDAGIEVILDVVYNHTGEGNHLGPTLSLRGIDNAAYYRPLLGEPRYYANESGCGNTLNLGHPMVLRMVMDSLRYWAGEMHVDGFRFDLATALARDAGNFNPDASFFFAVQQDPVLSRVKLIAEPWDLGNDGYQLGAFPPGWAEWNDQYRNEIRSFWKGAGGRIGVIASRLTGSSDIFEHRGRRPSASINFITAHDGFTLEDLVSYNVKRNDANMEGNQDGTDENLSWNCGEEGPTDNPEILALRAQQKRNFLATLFLSQGVLMLTAGDEFGRTQKGNNNAYCQDNEISWLNWNLERETDRQLLEFVRLLSRIRHRHPVFSRSRFFHGDYSLGAAVKDITWLAPAGREMSDEDWHQPFARCIGFCLGGDTGDYRNQAGQSENDDRFIILLNAHEDAIAFTLPPASSGNRWQPVLDTARPGTAAGQDFFAAEETYPLKGRSLALLEWEQNGKSL